MILLTECCGCGMIFNHNPVKFMEEVKNFEKSGITALEGMGFTCHNCTKEMDEMLEQSSVS